MEPLSSLQNPRVKQAVKLRQRRGREQQGRFIVEGYRELARAVERRLPITELYIAPELYLGDNEPGLVERAREQCGAEVIPVAVHVFEKLAYRDRPEGLLAVAPVPVWDLGTLPRSENPFWVVAVAIEKPGNLGTILRSADAAGCDGVIVCDRCTDLFNPNVVRASTGALFTVPVAEAAGDEVRRWLRDGGVRTVATTPAAEKDLWHADLCGPLAVIVGSEQVGLGDAWLEDADLKVQIPMAGRADSLNAATATTVVLFEVVRQRAGE